MGLGRIGSLNMEEISQWYSNHGSLNSVKKAAVESSRAHASKQKYSNHSTHYTNQCNVYI